MSVAYIPVHFRLDFIMKGGADNKSCHWWKIGNLWNEYNTGLGIYTYQWWVKRDGEKISMPLFAGNFDHRQ